MTDVDPSDDLEAVLVARPIAAPGTFGVRILNVSEDTRAIRDRRPLGSGSGRPVGRG